MEDKSAAACAHCGNQGVPLKKCLRCKQAAYCGPECQKAGWPQHKETCEPALWAAARDGRTDQIGQLLEDAKVPAKNASGVTVPPLHEHGGATSQSRDAQATQSSQGERGLDPTVEQKREACDVYRRRSKESSATVKP
ncbi:hypothetical protein T484DRAFT_1609988 [Baffinella frigidus]|nr:hypothetical protein T484DRAFT_1609988 [Cryptophyta sp. CCMP2293]